MSLLKPQKELVVNVLQQDDGKDETVQIRIQSGELEEVTMEPEVPNEEPHAGIEEVQEDMVEVGVTSYDEPLMESDEANTLSSMSTAKHPDKASRYHKYRQRWSNTWLEKPEFRGWLTRNAETRNAHCLLCRRDVRGSRSMLERHSKTGKHIDNMTNFGSLVKQTSPMKVPLQSIRYMIDSTEASAVNAVSGDQILLVNQDGTHTNAVFLDEEEETHVETENFSNVLGEEDYTPINQDEVYVTIGLTEKFSASHRLHSNELTAFKNQEIFGKCNHANGHGHNYVFTVDVTGPRDKVTGMVMSFDELQNLIRTNVLNLLDHRNLDLDVAYFKDSVSTVENIAFFIWRQLRNVIDEKHHIRITVNETDKNRAVFPALI